MDTVTHGIAGSVFARSLTDRPAARAALILGLVGAMLPDVDLMFAHDRIEYLRDHRGWTHSFVYLPLLALGLAALVKVVYRSARHVPLRLLFLCAAVGIATHIVFDWITSFGTMFWIPFSRARHALDWVFILDPYFTAIVSLSLLGATIFRAKGRLISGIGAALLLAYLGLCGIMHSVALATWKRMDRPPEGARVAVLPQLLSPFRWLGVSDHEDAVHAAFFDVGPFAKGIPSPKPPTKISEVLTSLSDYYPPPERARVERYAKPPRSPVLDRVTSLPDVRTYLNFARFPLATVRTEKDGSTSVSFQDLRFLPWFTGPWERERGRVRYRRQPFVYRIRLDPGGRVLDRSFVGGMLD
jgi:inner membrane protein